MKSKEDGVKHNPERDKGNVSYMWRVINSLSKQNWFEVENEGLMLRAELIAERRRQSNLINFRI